MFYTVLCFNRTSLNMQTHRTASFLFSFLLTLKPMYDTISWLSLVWCDLAIFSCTIRASDSLLYDINLWATHTTILSTRGVKIPIYLVSITTDSIRWCVVLFKTVTIPTSDLKSEFLCQSTSCCAEPAEPLNHLVRLGHLPCLRQHVSSLLP